MSHPHAAARLKSEPALALPIFTVDARPTTRSRDPPESVALISVVDCVFGVASGPPSGGQIGGPFTLSASKTPTVNGPTTPPAVPPVVQRLSMGAWEWNTVPASGGSTVQYSVNGVLLAEYVRPFTPTASMADAPATSSTLPSYRPRAPT